MWDCCRRSVLSRTKPGAQRQRVSLEGHGASLAPRPREGGLRASAAWVVKVQDPSRFSGFRCPPPGDGLAVRNADLDVRSVCGDGQTPTRTKRRRARRTC